MKTINKITNRLNRVILVVAAILLCAIFLTTVYQVVARTLGASVSWVDEFCRYTVIVLLFYGAALSARKGTGLRVTIVVNMFPLKLKRWVDVVQYSIVLAFMIWFNYSLYLGILNLGDQTLGIMTAIKLSWVYWTVFGAVVLMNIYFLLFIIELFDPKNPRYIAEKKNDEIEAKEEVTA